LKGFLDTISEQPFETHVLSNGIRLVHQRISSTVAYCSLLSGTGSRDESDNQHGAAHLIEHLIFKKTAKRKAHHILSRMENVGGEINAYTNKEDTCVHATFLCPHYERALELFYDIVFNHRFDEKLIQLEKSVVIYEINSSKETPAEVLFDEFDKFLFPNHPLGKNILGTTKSINTLNIKELEQFVSDNYQLDKIIIASVGNISFERLIKYVEKYFGTLIPKQNPYIQRVKPADYVPFKKEFNKKGHQSHVLLGRSHDDIDNQFRIASTLLANLVGGSGMNTKLNMLLREKLGLVYHVEASYSAYSDIGIFQIYFASEKSKVEKCIILIEKELEKLKKQPLTKDALKRLQMQTMCQLAMSADFNDARMLSAAKSTLVFDKISQLSDIYQQISEIDAEQICEIANDLFSDLSLLVH
jgi:predicted Zn-dependent peptidase